MEHPRRGLGWILIAIGLVALGYMLGSWSAGPRWQAYGPPQGYYQPAPGMPPPAYQQVPRMPRGGYGPWYGPGDWGHAYGGP
ncbi:MAG TPA: hypothetical protein VNL77_09225, partial [Roseiflexaceae bacterium]|nr:hypothetical protein [Roseiflexaceae bacterium]